MIISYLDKFFILFFCSNDAWYLLVWQFKKFVKTLGSHASASKILRFLLQTCVHVCIYPSLFPFVSKLINTYFKVIQKSTSTSKAFMLAFGMCSKTLLEMSFWATWLKFVFQSTTLCSSFMKYAIGVLLYLITWIMSATTTKSVEEIP